MAITEVLAAPRSPWQNGVIELFIGSLRRECLDHVIIFTAAGLERLLTRLHRVLRTRTDTLRAGQRRAHHADGLAIDRRQNRGHSAGRWPSSSLRAHRCVRCFASSAT